MAAANASLGDLRTWTHHVKWSEHKRILGLQTPHQLTRKDNVHCKNTHTHRSAGLRAGVLGSNPRSVITFLSSPKRTDRFWSPPWSQLNIHRSSFPVLKRPERQDTRSPEESYALLPPVCVLMAPTLSSSPRLCIWWDKCLCVQQSLQNVYVHFHANCFLNGRFHRFAMVKIRT